MSKNDNTGLIQWLREMDTRLAMLREWKAKNTNGGGRSKLPAGSWTQFTWDLLMRGVGTQDDSDNIQMKSGEISWSVWGKTESLVWMDNEAAKTRIKAWWRKCLTKSEKTIIKQSLAREIMDAQIETGDIFTGELVGYKSFGGLHIAALLDAWWFLFPRDSAMPYELRFTDSTRHVAFLYPSKDGKMVKYAGYEYEVKQDTGENVWHYRYLDGVATPEPEDKEVA